MRKFLLGLAALAFLALAVPAPADAGWNIRQNDDGTTDWVREVPGSTETHAVGSRTFNVHVTDISTAATFGVVSPLTYAKVSYIQHVIEGDLTGSDATYTFFVADSDGTVASQITGGVSGLMTIDAMTASNETGTVDTFTPSADNEIEQDQSILIHTDGGSTNTVRGRFTITVEPR